MFLGVTLASVYLGRKDQESWIPDPSFTDKRWRPREITKPFRPLLINLLEGSLLPSSVLDALMILSGKLQLSGFNHSIS